MNPYPKPPAGSYRDPMILGLRLNGRPEEAQMVEVGSLKLAIAASITGAVKTQPQLTALCRLALDAAPQTEVTRYYSYQLDHGLAVPALTDGAYVYREDEKAAVDFVRSMDRTYAPGELFLKS